MILIIGGAYQGKTEYVKETYGVEPAECTPETALQTEAVNRYHELVRVLLEQGIDPKEYAVRLVKDNPDAIVICDEVGMGVVPVEKDVRIWREAVGRSLKILAQAAESVVRVYAGIPEIIK